MTVKSSGRNKYEVHLNQRKVWSTINTRLDKHPEGNTETPSYDQVEETLINYDTDVRTMI